MNSRKKFFFVFCFIIINFILLVSFLVIRDATSYNSLKKEVDKILLLDIMKDKYDTKIVCSGKYGVVEKNIKKYFGHITLELEEINSTINDERLATVLSYENYSNDGPLFSNSLSYLETSKNSLNKKIDSLQSFLSNDGISSYISNKIKEQYYKDLFIEIMNSSGVRQKRDEISQLLVNTKQSSNDVYDGSLSLLNYLKAYNDQWKLEDGEIKFQTQEMYDYYTEVISSLR